MNSLIFASLTAVILAGPALNTVATIEAQPQNSVDDQDMEPTPTGPVELCLGKKKMWGGGYQSESMYSTQDVQPSTEVISSVSLETDTSYVTMPGYASTIYYQSQSSYASTYATADTSTTTYPPVTVGSSWTSVYTLPDSTEAAAVAQPTHGRVDPLGRFMARESELRAERSQRPQWFN